ncbi:tRNA(Met) cytidine acetyltransferase TmcA domain-containing protein, partial [Haloplanus litoreus]|uniref:tRNA(Met) cytidine acetyltransferase TmcA domain-containing protein n=1 Tax=Haloplanus litoreus TaxID=767515 RepID=UPI00363C07D1
MDLDGVVAALRAEAVRANERRLLTLAGDRNRGLAAAADAVAAYAHGSTSDRTGAENPDVTVLTTRDNVGWAERIVPRDASRLLGTTRDVVVLDAHAGFSANVLGRVVRAVDGT